MIELRGRSGPRTVQREKSYSDKFKDRMVRRMAGAGGRSANALSKEVGVSQATLSRWLRQAGSVSAMKEDEKQRPTPPPRRPEDWSPQEKLAAVIEAAAVAEADLGVWLRRKGLKEAHLQQWREMLAERASSVFAPRQVRGSAEDRKRLKELERELRRKDKALAETAALLVLQGKMQALWAEEDGATRQSSDEPSCRASRRRRPRERG
jgi:transposase